jgi:hypothetical protein
LRPDEQLFSWDFPSLLSWVKSLPYGSYFFLSLELNLPGISYEKNASAVMFLTLSLSHP